MITLDDPRHTRLRCIVNRAFTPKVIARIEQSVRDRARRLVAEMVDAHPDGTADFVEEVASPLPLQIICDMMGVPEEDRAKLFHWTSVLMGAGDDEVSTAEYGEYLQVATELAGYGVALAEQRREHPANDLTTSLIEAEVDGERLSSNEIASFFILLTGGGQRHDPQRDQPRDGGAEPLSRRTCHVVERLRPGDRRLPSRRSCGGRHRSSSCGARSPRTWSAAAFR